MTEVPVELSEDDLKRKDLILRNLQEALGTEKLVKQLTTPGKTVHLYWGTAPTGKPHVGYMVPMQKIADFLHANIKVTILFADMHAFLDNLKSTFEMLDYRVKYYELTIKALLSSLNVPLEKLHFVRGIDHQLSKEYTKDVLRLCGHVSQRDAIRAGAEVVKQVDNPLLSGLLYPLLQAVDEQYLKVDGQFGGVDQRKIFILAEEQLPKIKLGKRWHLMNPMIPGLTGGKMSSSEIDSKIDLLDSREDIARKIDGAVCQRGNPDENGILAFFHFVILPISGSETIILDGKNFLTFEDIRDSFENGTVSEESLKDYLKQFLTNILTKVQEKCKTPELTEIMEIAYPKHFKVNDELPKDVKMYKLVAEPKESLADLRKKLEDLPKLKEKLAKNEPIKVLWRVGAKGKINLAHVAGLIQLKKLKKLGCKCTILISDIAGFLADSETCPWNAIENRAKYYEEALKLLASAIGLSGIEFIQSSTNEYEKEFTLDMYKMASKVNRGDTSAIVGEGKALATHLGPLYYALDIHYANPDLVIVGENQKEWIKLAEKLYESLKFPQLTVLFFPTILGTNGERMSSTKADFHLDVSDTANQVKSKINKSFCEEKNVKDNIALDLAKLVIFPLEDGKGLTIERPETYGGNVVLTDYEYLESLFLEGKIHPSDLKPWVIKRINAILEPARTGMTALNKLIQAAFPKVQKKK